MVFAPSEIEKDLFEILLSHVESQKNVDITFMSKNLETNNLLRTCFRLDTNSTLVHYKIIDMDLLFKNYDPKVIIAKKRLNVL